MKTRLSPLGLLAWFSILGLSCAQPDAVAPKPAAGEKLILIGKVRGHVTLTVDKSTKQAFVDQEVPAGAILRTGRNSAVIFASADGVVAHLGPDSELQVIARGDTLALPRFALNRGDLVTQARPRQEVKGLLVETPLGSAESAGTSYVLIRPANAEDQFFQISCAVGEVKLRPIKGNTVRFTQGWEVTGIVPGGGIAPAVDAAPPLAPPKQISLATVSAITDRTLELAVVFRQTPFTAPTKSP